MPPKNWLFLGEYIGEEKSFEFCTVSNFCFLCYICSFPSKAERRKEWLRLCNLDPNTIVTNARFCCKHFKEEDFKMSASGRQLLKRGVVPSVFFNETYTGWVVAIIFPGKIHYLHKMLFNIRRAPVENVPLSPAPKRGSNYNHSCIICGRSNGTSSYHR